LTDEKLPRLADVRRILKPSGHGLMPAEIVTTHQHVMALRKPKQKIRATKVKLIGSRPQSNPLQFIGGNDDAALLLDELGEIRIILHIANDDRRTENQSVMARMCIKRKLAGNIAE
jgi:hypothetical protein